MPYAYPPLLRAMDGAVHSRLPCRACRPGAPVPRTEYHTGNVAHRHKAKRFALGLRVARSYPLPLPSSSLAFPVPCLPRPLPSPSLAFSVPCLSLPLPSSSLAFPVPCLSLLRTFPDACHAVSCSGRTAAHPHPFSASEAGQRVQLMDPDDGSGQWIRRTNTDGSHGQGTRTVHDSTGVAATE